MLVGLVHNHSGVKHLVTILPSWYRNAYSGILFFDSKTVRKLVRCEMTELFVAQVTSREAAKIYNAATFTSDPELW